MTPREGLLAKGKEPNVYGALSLVKTTGAMIPLMTVAVQAIPNLAPNRPDIVTPESYRLAFFTVPLSWQGTFAEQASMPNGSIRLAVHENAFGKPYVVPYRI